MLFEVSFSLSWIPDYVHNACQQFSLSGSIAKCEATKGAMEAMLADVVSSDALSAFDRLEVPIVAINADLWPTAVEANRRHMHSFDAVIIEGTDHFLHMAEPDSSNRELKDVIAGMI